MKGFTKIPNWLLDSYNGLTNAEFRVLMCIYRLTAGFHRKSYKIEYSLITEMTGVKNVSIICNSLKQMGWIDFNAELGKANVINILKPINSVNGLQNKVINSVNDTHSVSEPHPLTHLNGSRGAKENYKENLKKDLLFLEFKKKYPEDKFDDDTVFNFQYLVDYFASDIDRPFPNKYPDLSDHSSLVFQNILLWPNPAYYLLQTIWRLII